MVKWVLFDDRTFAVYKKIHEEKID